MVLHKMVNGIKVDCTPEEEAQILAEWEQNAILHEQEKTAKQEADAANLALKNSAITKLKNIVLLTDDEITALLTFKIDTGSS